MMLTIKSIKARRGDRRTPYSPDVEDLSDDENILDLIHQLYDFQVVQARPSISGNVNLLSGLSGVEDVSDDDGDDFSEMLDEHNQL